MDTVTLHDDLRTDKNAPGYLVWWIPQVPMQPFKALVSTLVQAKTLVEAFAQYDLFQLRNNIKPDYSNAGGVMVFEDGEWTDFYTDDGEEFDSLSVEDCARMDAAKEATNAQ